MVAHHAYRRHARSCRRKRRHRSEYDALKAQHATERDRGYDGKPLTVYECSFCHGWHVGHAKLHYLTSHPRTPIMKIVSLEVENVKRIKAVQITPTGELVVIGGRNAQGKSSCLDAIEMALAGKSAIPEQPIRRGSDSAYVLVTFDDGMTVERTFKGDNSYLVVKRGDGTRAGTPQALLDSLCSRIAFDPLAFMRAKPAEQANQLRGLVGLDFRAQDIARKNAYDHRTDVNRQVKQAEAAAQAMPIVEGAPAEEISVGDLMAELKRRHAANADVDKAHAALDEHNRKLAGFQKQLTDAEFELASLKVRIENLTGTIAKGTYTPPTAH